jgi:hypothetical protein
MSGGPHSFGLFVLISVAFLSRHIAVDPEEGARWLPDHL